MLIVLLWILLIVFLMTRILLVGLLLLVGGVKFCTNYDNMLSISGTIHHCIFVFVPIPRFVIGLYSIFVVFFVDIDYTILDKSLLREHAFFLDIFAIFEEIHDHTVRKTGGEYCQ